MNSGKFHQSPFLDTLMGFEYTFFFLSSQLIDSEQDITDGTSCHLENPVLALGSRTVSMIMDLGRIAQFILKGFVLIFSLPLRISKIKQ